MVFHIYIFYTIIRTTNVLLTKLRSRGRLQASQIFLNPKFLTAPTNSSVPWSLASGKTLGFSNSTINSNYFLGPVTIRVIKSQDLWRVIKIYFGILILSPIGKIMVTSLIDYFSKQQLSVFNNDCWNFHKLKQQYQLIGLISQIFTLFLCENGIYQLIL